MITHPASCTTVSSNIPSRPFGILVAHRFRSAVFGAAASGVLWSMACPRPLCYDVGKYRLVNGIQDSVARASASVLFLFCRPAGVVLDVRASGVLCLRCHQISLLQASGIPIAALPCTHATDGAATRPASCARCHQISPSRPTPSGIPVALLEEPTLMLRRASGVLCY
ncbi:hypothetical protein AAG906_010616 [Vitis piasezkii]